MRPESNFRDLFKSKRRKAIEDAETLKELRDKTEFEKSDLWALIIAGLTTIVPVAVIILLLYYFLTMLVFG